jgi:hypothetical protein
MHLHGSLVHLHEAEIHLHEKAVQLHRKAAEKYKGSQKIAVIASLCKNKALRGVEKKYKMVYKLNLEVKS